MAYTEIPAAGGFGSDTLIELPNSANNLVTALELATSLTTNTAGAEVSKLVISLINAGSATTAQDIRPGQTLFPNGNSNNPGVSFQGATDAGMYFAGGGILGLVASGTPKLLITNGDVSITSGSPLHINTDGQRGIGQVGSNIYLFSDANFQLGADNAIATNATVGFVEFPTCAGTPTGAVTPRTGKVILVYDTTAHKMWSREGGTWRSTTFA